MVYDAYLMDDVEIYFGCNFGHLVIDHFGR